MVAKSYNLNIKTLDYWVSKIELTKTHVTRKREIIEPNVDIRFLSFLIGLIDGDGYIQAKKSSKGYIEFNLTITFHNRDLATFEYLISKLHFGVIAKINSSTSRLIIYNFELKYILVPLLLKYNLFFLTKNRINQYNLLLYTIENNIKKWKFLPKVIPNYVPWVMETSEDIVQNVFYFKDWFAGFVVAEGSFYVQANKEICFNVGQKGNSVLMNTIYLLFEPSRALNYTKSKDISIVRISSLKDIQKVVNFFSFENHYPLTGYKKESYIAWLKALKESDRYKDLNFPLTGLEVGVLD